MSNYAALSDKSSANLISLRNSDTSKSVEYSCASVYGATNQLSWGRQRWSRILFDLKSSHSTSGSIWEQLFWVDIADERSKWFWNSHDWPDNCFRFSPKSSITIHSVIYGSIESMWSWSDPILRSYTKFELCGSFWTPLCTFITHEYLSRVCCGIWTFRQFASWSDLTRPFLHFKPLNRANWD